MYVLNYIYVNEVACSKEIAEYRNHTTETNRFKGNQEFLTLILNPHIAFLCGHLIHVIRVKNSRPTLGFFLGLS